VTAPVAPVAQAPTGGGATTPDPAQPPPPPPPPGGGPAGDPKEDLRNQASLGPSAPTSAFDPIDGTKPDKGGPPESPKVDPKTLLRAKVGAVTLGGKPAPEALTRALKIRVSEVQACYDRAPNKPTKAAQVKLSFKLVETQLVAPRVDTSTLKNVELEGCIVGVVQETHLDKSLGTDTPVGTVIITFARR